MDETGSLLSGLVSDYGAAVSTAESALEPVDPVTLTWNNVQVEVDIPKVGRRRLLDGVSGIAKPGQLLAMMGASGAGKTTLLNTLLCRNLKGLIVNGRVEVNGEEMGRDITRVSGYAQQEELFVGTLSVREYLEIQARLRVAGNAERRRKRVNTVLVQLGLLKCQNTRIGVSGVKKGISGGEARRLTFACELLSNPAILFCDEPTTGLDSFMAESVVGLLSRLAHSGRTIVCTIHQPASQLFALFDSVLFLAGGRTAFLGSPTTAIRFFEECGHPCPDNYNPADLIIHTLAVVPHEEVACRERIAAICDRFEDGDHGRTLREELDRAALDQLPPPRSRSKAGIFTQIQDEILKTFSFNASNFYLDQGLMIAFIFLFYGIGLVGLSVRVYRSR